MNSEETRAVAHVSHRAINNCYALIKGLYVLMQEVLNNNAEIKTAFAARLNGLGKQFLEQNATIAIPADIKSLELSWVGTNKCFIREIALRSKSSESVVESEKSEDNQTTAEEMKETLGNSEAKEKTDEKNLQVVSLEPNVIIEELRRAWEKLCNESELVKSELSKIQARLVEKEQELEALNAKLSSSRSSSSSSSTEEVIVLSNDRALEKLGVGDDKTNSSQEMNVNKESPISNTNHNAGSDTPITQQQHHSNEEEEEKEEHSKNNVNTWEQRWSAQHVDRKTTTVRCFKCNKVGHYRAACFSKNINE